jgi:hypothetical protein
MRKSVRIGEQLFPNNSNFIRKLRFRPPQVVDSELQALGPFNLLNRSLKGEVKKKHFCAGWSFSSSQPTECEQDLL